MDEINALVEEKIEADADFQASLAELAEEDRETALATKRSEVLSSEFAALKEKADKAAKAEEVAANQKARAEKAEAEAKALKGNNQTETPAAAPGISTADALALVNAKVHEDDVERVERFAVSEGISIKEALKNPELKAILAIRTEARDTASAANVAPVRRGSAAVTDAALIAKANKGEDLSDEELERVMKAKASQR